MFVIHILCYHKGSIQHYMNPKHEEEKQKDGPRPLLLAG